MLGSDLRTRVNSCCAFCAGCGKATCKIVSDLAEFVLSLRATRETPIAQRYARGRDTSSARTDPYVLSAVIQRTAVPRMTWVSASTPVARPCARDGGAEQDTARIDTRTRPSASKTWTVSTMLDTDAGPTAIYDAIDTAGLRPPLGRRPRP